MGLSIIRLQDEKLIRTQDNFGMMSGCVNNAQFQPGSEFVRLR